MVEYMEMMTVTEAENLKRTIRDLFRQTCIIQMKYDPATLVPRDNPNYRVCLKHQRFIEDYLAVIGCELHYDPQEHIFRLEGEGVLTEKLSETTTLLVLIMKLIYRDKIMGEGLHATVTNLAEIREYGKDTGLINRRLTTAEWREALGVMRTHQMIELPGAIVNVEDDTPIYIYSTVNIYCASTDINAIVAKYQKDLMQMHLDMNEAIEMDGNGMDGNAGVKTSGPESEQKERTDERSEEEIYADTAE